MKVTDNLLSRIRDGWTASASKDFSRPEYPNLLDVILDASISKLEFPGTRDEGPRSCERATNVVISNCDILIAAWDGLPASGVAETRDVV